MGTYIVIGILLIVVFLAVRSSRKHLSGEGGCCGGTSSADIKPKKLTGSVIIRKKLEIEGMHCKNCKNHVMEALNGIEGISATVNLKKKSAIVRGDRIFSDEELKAAVEKAGYQIVQIQEYA